MTVTQDNIISAEVLHKITKKTQQKWGAELIHKKNINLHQTGSFV